MIALRLASPGQVGDNHGNDWVGFSGKYDLAVELVEEQRSTKWFCFSDVGLLNQIVTGVAVVENDISILPPPQVS